MTRSCTHKRELGRRWGADAGFRADTGRKSAQLALPVTRVRLEYRGYTEAEAARAVALFDRAFRRGGG